MVQVLFLGFDVLYGLMQCTAYCIIQVSGIVPGFSSVSGFINRFRFQVVFQILGDVSGSG